MEITAISNAIGLVTRLKKIGEISAMPSLEMYLRISLLNLVEVKMKMAGLMNETKKMSNAKEFLFHDSCRTIRCLRPEWY